MYYVGTQQFSSFNDAMSYVRANGGSITNEPVGDTAGMLTGDSGETEGTTTSPTPQTFTFIEGSERGDARPGELYGQTAEPQQVTAQELQEYFNDPDRTNRLPEVFGTFDNYLGYMTEREQLLQSGDLTLGDWGSAANITGPTETITLEDGTEVEIPAIDIGMSIGGGGELGIGQAGGGGGANLAAESELMLQQGAYNDWLNSEVNSALLQKYGVSPVVYSETGDKFQWNGSSYVKTVDIENPDAGDFVKAGLLAAVSYYAGGALTEALGPVFGGNTALASGASAGITNSAMQLAATGEVDLGEAFESAISAGLGQAAINYLQESGALESITESLNDLTQDTVQLADGTELPINTYGNNTFVTLSDGTEVLYSDFITQTAEAGNAVIAEIDRTTSDFINIVADAFESSGAAQGVVNVLESIESSSSPYPTASEGQATFNLPGFETIGEEEQQQVEQTETPVQEPAEDIFTDTTQEATGLEETTVRELLDEYIQPVLASLEDQDLETTGIQTAIGTITEQQQQTLQEFVRQGGQIEQLDSNQQQIIQDLGGVDTVVNDLAENVSGLEQGLQEAATEREDIRASQEAGFTEAEQDRIRIEQSTNDKLEQLREGIAVEFTDAEARRVEEITGLEARLLQDSAANAAEFARLLESEGQRFDDITGALSSDIQRLEETTGERITGLEERIDANAIEQLAQLTGLRTEFLETLTASEAAAIARNQGLSDQLTEEITGVRGETAAQIEGINERLTNRIDAYEQQTGEQLELAEEERAALGGQLGTLTTDIARVAEDVIRAGGRIEELDEAGRQRYEELGLSIEDLSLRVGVNLEALQQGMLTQDAALRELVEETTRQTEQSLTERLEEAEQGFATSLSDTEANLLSQITGVEAGVLQQLATVEGGLREQFGEQFDVVQQQVGGLGEQVAGLGEGLAGLGAGLGMGLLGLGQQQQQLAAQLAKPDPIPFDPFLKGLSPFQPLTPIALAPQKQTDAMSELNKFIGRQSGMLV